MARWKMLCTKSPMRLFARLSSDSALPDCTTIMNFRHLLESINWPANLFKTINRWLVEAGVMMTQGTWSMPPSFDARHPARPEQKQQRDPEMHQTKKRQSVALWHEGPHWCRCQSGLTHSLVTTAHNEHDLNQLGNLLHGRAICLSRCRLPKGHHSARSWLKVDVDWLIAERPGKVRTLKQHPRRAKRPSTSNT